MQVLKPITLGIAALALGGTAAPRTARSACALARADSRGELVHVPFKQIDGRIYVDVLVNGKGPYVFALDTGASGIGRADNRLVAALELPSGTETQTSDGVQVSQVKTVKVRSLRLGRLERSEQEVIARDYRSRMAPEAAFAGILGREFFGDGLLVIDYGRQTVSFTRSRSMNPAMPGGMRYAKAFRVPITIGGIETPGHLDTGANVSLILPLAFYSKVSSEPLGEQATGTLTNTRITTHRATIKGPVRVGNVTSSGVQARVSEQFPEVVVGAHFLRNRVLLIDQRSQTVALCPARAKRPAEN